MNADERSKDQGVMMMHLFPVPVVLGFVRNGTRTTSTSRAWRILISSACTVHVHALAIILASTFVEADSYFLVQDRVILLHGGSTGKGLFWILEDVPRGMFRRNSIWDLLVLRYADL